MLPCDGPCDDSRSAIFISQFNANMVFDQSFSSLISRQCSALRSRAKIDRRERRKRPSLFYLRKARYEPTVHISLLVEGIGRDRTCHQ